MASFSKPSPLPADGDHFDMWHDYLNLGRQLEGLCGAAEVDRRRTTERPEESPRRRLQLDTSQGRSGHDSESAETSSISSVSDSSSSGGTPPPDCCRFCKQNGETARVFQSHKLKAEDGRVTCPVLWSFTCPICGATGDRAHTPRHCPQTQRGDAAATLPRPRFW